eukprot:CAMPEP_0178584764 /NCGR_PEP_ID=MMETSP0697-20121206/25017_1 /TAXON_ID=265572 /ORGANISM="Extubocellulus spinifer, Strain CCMP396" /LENGTH=134 /DNA_ID=CAMNT_0020220755 /DNA_START=483 /DNA_END=887 /DNA_ORIENTATION=+
MLESIGFKWSTPSNWEKRYEELCQYRDAHHHCNVPDKWAQNQPLGYWVSKQRQDYKKGTLAPDRITMLESIEFYVERRRTQLSLGRSIPGTLSVSRCTSSLQRAAEVATKSSTGKLGKKSEGQTQEGNACPGSD